MILPAPRCVLPSTRTSISPFDTSPDCSLIQLVSPEPVPRPGDTPVTFGVPPLNEPLTPNEDDLLELSPVSGTEMMLRSRPTLAVIVSLSTTASFRLVSRPDSMLILPDPVTWLLTCVAPLLFDLPEPPFAPRLQPPVALPRHQSRRKIRTQWYQRGYLRYALYPEVFHQQKEHRYGLHGTW